MPTSATLPDTITRRTRAHRHTHDATSPTQHNGTVAPWRVSPNTAHAYNPRTAPPTPTRSIQAHKPHTPARRPAQHQPLRTARSSLHARRRAHVTHSMAHSSDHPTRRPQKITRSHTHGVGAALTSELSERPASTGCCRRVGWCPTPTTCRTHDQPSRHAMAPDADTERSQAPATHLSASHSINQIKTNESQSESAHCMLSLTHNTVCE
jgi:hypothetical protein